MPYVNVRITKDGATTEQKKQIVQEITETLVRVLHKNPQTTHVVIDEVELENWAIGGETVAERRRQNS